MHWELLGRTYIIKDQNSPKGGVNGKAQTSLERSLVECHLARMSRHDGFSILMKPHLDSQKNTIPIDDLQFILGHYVRLFLE